MYFSRLKIIKQKYFEQKRSTFFFLSGKLLNEVSLVKYHYLKTIWEIHFLNDTFNSTNFAKMAQFEMNLFLLTYKHNEIPQVLKVTASIC